MTYSQYKNLNKGDKVQFYNERNLYVEAVDLKNKRLYLRQGSMIISYSQYNYYYLKFLPRNKKPEYFKNI